VARSLLEEFLMPKPTDSSSGQGGNKGGGGSESSPLTITGFSPDTGIDGDGISNVDDEQLSTGGLLFTGTGDGTQTVFYVDGVAVGEVVWATEPNEDGSYDWSFVLYYDDLVADDSSSAEGTYEITVGFQTFSKNGRSTTTTYSDPFQLTIDQSVTGTINGLNLDTGAASDDWLTQDNTPVVSGTAEVGATVTLHVKSVEGVWTYLADETVAADGTWSLTAIGQNGALADGVYELSVEIRDLAGNVVTLTQNLTVDTTTVQPTVAGEALTADSTPAFS
jgi:hypothetical protein